MRKIVLWNPHNNQLAIANDTSRFKVVVCGRRFGKTVYAVNYLIEEALLTKNGLFFYIAPTYKQAKMIAWEMLLQAIRKLPRELVHKVNESELYVVLGNDTKIAIKGADNPDSLRGVGLNGVILDEYQDQSPSVFTDVIRPALTDKKGWSVFIGTPKGFNHFYDLFVHAEKTEGWKGFKFTSYDNPLLDPAEIDEARKALPEDIFAQEYLAEFRKMKGLVYKEFNRDLHVVQTLPERQFIEVLAGVDFGYTNPAAILVIGKDFDNNYWVVDEYYERGKTTNELVEILQQRQQKFSLNFLYPDPAEPDRIEEINRSGLTCREVSKDIAAGVDRVRALFKGNRIRILASCTNLIWELETYHYPDTREGRNEYELPVKENDHAVDALRYALFSNQPTDVRESEGEFALYTSNYT